MNAPATRKRLDVLLAERGLARSRSEARDLILRGAVTVAGRRAEKPSETHPPDVALAIAEGSGGVVSRAALKLVAALDAFHLSPDGLTALDIGASTGGFTQVLLARGAARVYAVDVGRDQLESGLRADPRVVSLEATDARALHRRLIPEPPAVLVADVSFISLRTALPAPLSLLAHTAWAVVLVKPQFELGPDAVGKRGVVRDVGLAGTALTDIAAWFAAQPGWRVTGTMASPLPGREGNTEYLLAAQRW
jgi:23S rRNA (cytidine1920-2'-O)/16S rRNA (cytidine1409-2'-O)-methyltransferase